MVNPWVFVSFHSRPLLKIIEINLTFSNLNLLVHGVPISLKDHFNVEGVDSTVGFTQCAKLHFYLILTIESTKRAGYV